MKRALLIAGGTVGGLGAVLSITPPQLSSHGLATIAGASADTSIPAATQSSAAVTTTTSATPTAAAVATKKATASPTKSATTKKSTTSSSTSSSSSSSSSNSSSSNSSTTSATPTPAATKATSTASGSFTGDAFNVGYGMVQVKITVSNGKITDAVAVQAPSGRNQRWSDYAVPNLRQQTLSAQSAAISGVSGASYTSYGWYKSLISALQKAGMTTGV
jgi:uncharacterized protein with FMN-binding domain